MDGSETQLNISVENQSGSIVHFKIRPSTPLGRLMEAYCDEQGVLRKSIVFLYDGCHVSHDATAASLKMEDGDNIQAFIHQEGGGE